MNSWRPCKRREFIQKLRRLGFDGPYSGTRHQFLLFQHYRLSIPANSEYSIPQLRMMLEQVETILDRKISLEEWNQL
jgi:hypothetical protein